MEDVEQQRLEEQRILLEALEVEALHALERQRVVGVVEERVVRTALHPAMEMLRQARAAAGSPA